VRRLLTTALAAAALLGTAFTGSAVAAQHPTKVLTIVLENHGLAEMRAQMPYLRSLGDRYGYATGYVGVSHPSLPNYLAMAYGDTFGITDDAVPGAHPIGAPDIFSGALQAGTGARVYAEAMPAPCSQTNRPPYVVRHNPWAYSSVHHADCVAHDVAAGTPSSGALHDDVAAGALPCAGLLVPDLVHDAHDAPLPVADAYLRSWLPQVLAGPDFRAGRLVVVVTADETGHAAADNRVLTVVLSPRVTRRIVTTPLSHYGLSKLYSTTCRSPQLRRAATAPSLSAAFGL